MGQVNAESETPLAAPPGRGRPHAPGTILASVMTQRHMRVHQVGHVLHVSDRQVHNFLTRTRPIPIIHLGALCDLMDMDPDELVDEGNYLLPVVPSEGA